MSFLIPVNSVYFGVHFSDVSMIPNLYFDFFVHGVSFFIPSLSACACLWVWSESPIAAYIWILCLYQFIYYVFKCCCYCSSVLKSCLFLCDPVDCSMQGFPFLHYHPEFVQTHIHWVNDGIQPSHPQLSCMPSVFSSIMVFSSELVLCIKWPKYWSFNFIINEYSGLIAFRIDWFDLLAVQGTQESSLTPQFESINSLALSLLYGLTPTSIYDYWKNHSFDYMDLCWQSDVSDFFFLAKWCHTV